MIERARSGNGLVLGKFLPPHAGHLHLVRTAARACDAVTVLVCTRDEDAIPGGLRAQWMRELAAPIGQHVRIVHVTDDVPQAPEDHPRFWPIWTELCARYAGNVDVVFTSETYGDELASVLGAQHQMVDGRRERYPVSGTLVRSDPFGVWDLVPTPVRAHYAARVAVVGPESTGKTTLAAQLAAAFETAWVPEYGREHTAAIAARTPDGGWISAFCDADVETIARAQAGREDAAARQANRVLFCDTDLLTTRIWSEILLGRCPDVVRVASETRAYGLYLLLDVDVPWVDDGTRALYDRRQWHFDRIRATLDLLKRPYVVVRGSFDQRLACAATAVCERWPALVPA